MSFVEMLMVTFDQHAGATVLDLKPKSRLIDGMAGGRGRAGRPFKGPRHPTMVRFPVDHYEHYVRQAEELNVPVGDLVAYKMAIIEGLPIPEQVLMAAPGLLALLPEDQRARTLAEIPGLGARYRAVVGADPIPGLSTVGTAGEDATKAA